METTIARLKGMLCLGKIYKGEIVPISYANRTQAQRAANKAGSGWFVRIQRPFYVLKVGE